jgi:phosphoribosylaminoimidazolecarboxamide formyltransferase/IMP cyclohydrolase
VASADDLCTCWDQAFETDKQAPFGGIIVANRTVDTDLAERIKQIFCEIVIAPDFTPAAREMFAKRKNLRLMIAKGHLDASAMQDVRSVVGGVLVQDRDLKVVRREECKVATKRAPTEDEWRALMFAWKVVKHVKSNAIVYAAPERTLGIGAGQMSRVDSSRIAVWKAGEAAFPSRDRSSLPTPSSPSPTASSPQRRQVQPPASSPAARCATTRSSRRRTTRAWQWSSRASATSATNRLPTGC